MIAFVVAYAHNRVMGHGGGIPWHLPNDLRFFRRVTKGHTVVMGRKTYESIGKPLSDRRNVVLTSQRDFHAAGVEVVHSKAEILALDDDKYIIGGATLYDLFMPEVNKLYITEVDADVEGDTFFPAWDRTRFKKIFEESGIVDERNPFPHTFYIYERCTPL